MRPALAVVAAATPAGQRRLARLVARGARVLDRRTVAAARRIVDRVARGGDRALLAAVAEHDDRRATSVAELAWRPTAADRSGDALARETLAALELAIARVETYHRAQAHAGFRLTLDGLELEERRTPLARVGIYVPGGRAAYPSTVVMTVVPARVAGVREVVVATPPAALAANPALRFVLARLAVEEVWTIGGAQAVAALAHGTETVRAVAKLVGPGNAWVTAAKRCVDGRIGVDGVAGPSEVVIVAGEDAPPDWIAADLLAQAEHDPRAAAILIATSRALARAVALALERRLEALATASTARAALARFGAAFVVADLDQAARLVERLAPEHLQLVGAEPEAAVERFGPAGAVFVGAGAPEALGDYVAGPSHVLPTCGTARFASALGVDDFLRRSHVVRVSANAAPAELSRLAAAASRLAALEGLPAHAASAALRAAGERAA
ncbi:MAG: histidinol dehydrogenase [Thermoanaerobaculia bacterium]